MENVVLEGSDTLDPFSSASDLAVDSVTTGINDSDTNNVISESRETPPIDLFSTTSSAEDLAFNSERTTTPIEDGSLMVESEGSLRKVNIKSILITRYS